jgi:hypothetical protein
MVKNKSPKLCAWVAWIWLVVIVLSDGVAWTDDAAAAVGWAAGDGAVGVVAGGVVRGADGVVDLTGAAGAACRAGRRRRASTVTGGSGLPGLADGGAGVVSGAGVSDAGGVVVCGVSSGVDGVCDEAAPARQSAISAELLRKSKRLLRIDITPPLHFRRNRRRPRTSAKHGDSAALLYRHGHRRGEAVRTPDRCRARGGARAPSGE